jgi:hypothetical protein
VSLKWGRMGETIPPDQYNLSAACFCRLVEVWRSRAVVKSVLEQQGRGGCDSGNLAGTRERMVFSEQALRSVGRVPQKRALR